MVPVAFLPPPLSSPRKPSDSNFNCIGTSLICYTESEIYFVNLFLRHLISLPLLHFLTCTEQLFTSHLEPNNVGHYSKQFSSSSCIFPNSAHRVLQRKTCYYLETHSAAFSFIHIFCLFLPGGNYSVGVPPSREISAARV